MNAGNVNAHEYPEHTLGGSVRGGDVGPQSASLSMISPYFRNKKAGLGTGQ